MTTPDDVLNGRGDRGAARVAEVVRATDEQFRLLVQSVKDCAIFLLDPAGRVASWNAGAEHIKGYRAEEIVGEHFARFYPPEDAAAGAPARAMAAAAAAGRVEQEGWRVRKDGSRFWAHVIVTALRDEAGALCGYAKITRDLTERRQAEEALRRAHAELTERVRSRTAQLSRANRVLRQEVADRERTAAALRASEERFRTLADTAPVLIWVNGPDGCEFVNRAYLDFLGKSPEEARGMNWAEFVHPDDRPAYLDAYLRAAAARDRFAAVFRFRRRDGEYRWFQSVGVPRFSPDGAFLGYVGSSLDVTDSKRAEEALRESEQRFARFMQHLPGLAWIKDLTGRYVYANDAAVRAFRTPREQLYGKTDAEVFPPGTAAQFVANDRRALAAGADVQAVETLEHDDGVLHHSLVSKFPIPGPGGEPALVGGIAIDITDRMRAEEALREADRRKDEFLAMLAHELRNPLAAARTAVEVLRLPGLSAAEAGESRGVIGRQIEHLVRLVDDLLDVSRLLRGKVALRPEPVQLGEILRRAAELARPQLDARGHVLALTPPDRPVWLTGDRVRLAQVVANLLDNAAKFTDRPGRIALTAELAGGDREAPGGSTPGEAVIRVRDPGPGITPEFLPTVFDLFVQGDQSAARTQGGLGIGLTLVKRLVELHGGTVEAHSEGPGRGSEFTVRLPLAPMADRGVRIADSKTVHGDAASSPNPQSKPILVVDDNVDAAESLAVLLRAAGHAVTTAYSGPAALAAATAGRPDAIVLDIGLPGMDGYAVARQLRALPELTPGALIVALTGYGQDDDRRRSRAAGFDAHLVKPVNPDELLALVDAVTPRP